MAMLPKYQGAVTCDIFSSRPFETCDHTPPVPGIEMPGYFQMSLWDKSRATFGDLSPRGGFSSIVRPIGLIRPGRNRNFFKISWWPSARTSFLISACQSSKSTA
jgi:hypothetical protein